MPKAFLIRNKQHHQSSLMKTGPGLPAAIITPPPSPDENDLPENLSIKHANNGNGTNNNRNTSANNTIIPLAHSKQINTVNNHLSHDNVIHEDDYYYQNAPLNLKSTNNQQNQTNGHNNNSKSTAATNKRKRTSTINHNINGICSNDEAVDLTFHNTSNHQPKLTDNTSLYSYGVYSSELSSPLSYISESDCDIKGKFQFN